MKPVVWIVQEPMRKEYVAEIGWRWVSKGLDLASAGRYGNSVIVWPPDAPIRTREVLEAEAGDIARSYNDQNDFIVAVGSPTLIAMLSWAIGKAGKSLRMLEWDRKNECYFPTMGDTTQQLLQKGNHESAE